MIEITWLGHGTYQMRLATGEVIVVDPWIEGNPAYPKEHKLRPRGRDSGFARPLRSHPRRAAAVEEVLAARSWRFMRPPSGWNRRASKNTIGMNKGGTVTAGPISATMTHAVHSCGILDDGKIIYGGEAAGYVVRLAGQARGLLRRRHQRVHRHAAHRAAVPSGAGVSAHRRFVHHEPARGRAGLPDAERASA